MYCLLYAIVVVYIQRYSHKKYMYDEVSSVFFLKPFVERTIVCFYESKLLYPQMGYLKISFHRRLTIALAISAKWRRDKILLSMGSETWRKLRLEWPSSV